MCSTTTNNPHMLRWVHFRELDLFSIIFSFEWIHCLHWASAFMVFFILFESLYISLLCCRIRDVNFHMHNLLTCNCKRTSTFNYGISIHLSKTNKIRTTFFTLKVSICSEFLLRLTIRCLLYNDKWQILDLTGYRSVVCVRKFVFFHWSFDFIPTATGTRTLWARTQRYSF